jgi:hypothetical protein
MLWQRSRYDGRSDNMNDAVRMAQRLTEKEMPFYHPRVLICLKTMRIEGINLNKQFTIFKQKSIFLKIK